MTVAVPRSAPTAAVTVVAPMETAVTMPSVLPTVATAGSAEDHSNDTLIGRPLASYACAVSRSTTPALRLKADGEMTMATGGSEGCTDTVAVARRGPAVAVTVVVPAVIAVTVPSFVPTVATDGLADDHSKTALVARPLASVARAVKRPSAPTMRLNPAGEMETVTAGPGMVGTVSPPQASIVIAAAASRPCIGRWPNAVRERLGTVSLPGVCASPLGMGRSSQRAGPLRNVDLDHIDGRVSAFLNYHRLLRNERGSAGAASADSLRSYI